MNFLINNPQEFEKIFREYYTPLCNKVYKILKDKDLAEDVVQQVFINIWEKRQKIHIHSNVKSYLFKAVIYAAYNHIRKDYPFVEYESTYDDAGIYNDQLEYQETQQEITTIIDELPPACRTIFILSREEGLSYKEIAETLSISVKTVENQMMKALRILREKLSKYLVLIFILLTIF